MLFWSAARRRPDACCFRYLHIRLASYLHLRVRASREPVFSVAFYFDVPSRNIDHPVVNPMIYREIKVDALHCELGQTG